MCIIYTVCRGQVQALLEIAYRGLQDKDIMVRNASFFAIGQFSDHLQVSGRDTGAWVNLRNANGLVVCTMVSTVLVPLNMYLAMLELT